MKTPSTLRKKDFVISPVKNKKGELEYFVFPVKTNKPGNYLDQALHTGTKSSCEKFIKEWKTPEERKEEAKAKSKAKAEEKANKEAQKADKTKS